MISFIKVLEALRNGETIALLKSDFEQIFGDGFNSLRLSEWWEVFSDEETTIRNGIDLGSFGIFYKIIGVKKRGNTSRWNPSNDYRLSIVEIELFIKIVEVFECVVVTPEVKKLIFIGYGDSSTSTVLTSIAIYDEDLSPIVKDRVWLRLSRQDTSSIEVTCWRQVLWWSQVAVWSTVAALQSIGQCKTPTESSSLEKYEIFVAIDPRA